MRSTGNRRGVLEEFALSVIHSYANLDATIKSTPQYGFKKGMSVFQDEGHQATIKELDENLVGRDVIDLLDPTDISHKIFHSALNYLMFLKRKRSGTVKARGCANVSQQREFITNLQSSLPTVRTHVLFLGFVVDSIE